MENRLHPRIACSLPVILKFKNAQPLEATIANYCAGGVLIKLSFNLNEAAVKQQLNLFDDFTIIFQGVKGSGQEDIQLQAYIRRMDGWDLGVEFHNPNNNDVSILSRYFSGGNKGLNKPEVASSVQPVNKSLSNRFDGIRIEFWDITFRRFFGEIDKLLIELADQSKDNQEQQGYFQALNVLGGLGSQILSDLSANVDVELTEADFALQQISSEGVHQKEDLKVLEKNIFEDWLDVQMIISSLESDYFSPIFAINQYLTQLNAVQVEATNNPIGPCVICHTFKKLVIKTEFSRAVQSVIYRCFKNVLATTLNTLYQKVEILFNENGYKVINNTTSKAELVNASRQNVSAPDKNYTDSYVAHNAAETVRVLKGLQRGGGGEKPKNDNREQLSLNDINQRLESLTEDQKKQFLSVDQSLKQVFLNIMSDLLNDERGEKIVQEDQLDLLDVIDDIYGLLDKDGGLNSEINAWVKELKLPLLELILNDSSFLNNPNHSARKVVEQLVHIGSVERVSNKGLERTVKKHIDDIVDNYDRDNTVFDRANFELQKVIDRQENSFRRNAERVAKIHEGQQKLDRSKRIVYKLLADTVVGSSKPKVVLDIVNFGWRDLLVGACVRHGVDSPELIENVAVLQTIVDWIEGGASAAFDMEIEAPAIIELIDTQLAMSSAGVMPTKPLLEELRSIFYGNKKAELIDINEKDLGFEQTLLEEHDYFDAIPSKIKVEGNDERWIERIQRMQVGDWVEYEDDKTERRRMRLIWTGEDEYKFVFVNDQGMREIEFDVDDLIKDLDMGRIAFVDESDVSFVDKSLFNTVQSVYEQMVFQATHDPLTELVNRHEFEKILIRNLGKLKKNFSQCALCHIDINQFNIVNNNYGTQMGDMLLQVVEQKIKQQVGEGNLVGRIGGNEFGVLITDCDEAAAINLAEQWRELINNDSYLIKGEVITISVSVGLELMNSNTQSIITLLKNANLACMSAKQNFADRVVLYKADDYDQVHQNSVMNWAGRVDDAIATNQLQVRCQKIAPINNVATHEAHYEVLLGVTDEKGELTSPEQFIEAAEQFNRMPKVDRWVVESIFEWMEDNPDKISSMHGFSINLSGCSINDGRFLKFLLEKIGNTTVATEKICFEVTETATISNLNYAVDFINEVKKTGCKFSLDDFGTGMSSYEYLQKLPVDYLKIDGVFIKDIVDNEKNYAMVKSINELGHFLGKETIAEYVETEEILAVLKEIGVDHAQGYGVERPVLLSTI